MNPLLKVVLPCFAVAFGLCATAQTARQVTLLSRPETTVRNLYREMQNRAPSGLLDDTDKPRFSPYLSKSLRHKLDLAQACEKDWARQSRGQLEKAPFAWSEFGMFSGANERVWPGKFRIERVSKDDKGAFRVVVALSYRPGDGSGTWIVIDRVIQEDGRFVLDDVRFPKDEAEDGSTLTGRLSEGCNRGHWVGEGNQP